MISWGDCVLLHDHPGTSQTDVSGSQFEVAISTYEEHVRRKNPVKSPLTAASLEGKFVSFQQWELHLMKWPTTPRSVQELFNLVIVFPEQTSCRQGLKLTVSWKNAPPLLPDALY